MMCTLFYVIFGLPRDCEAGTYGPYLEFDIGKRRIYLNQIILHTISCQSASISLISNLRLS